MSADAIADRIAFLRQLRAVRQFRPEPVPEEAVADILQVMRWSGSASNQQPWEVVVVSDQETLHAMAQAEGYAKHLEGAPLAAVLVMANKRPEQDTFDEGRLSERIMLAAAAHGLGSSIGWFRGAGPDQVKALLGIPAERTVRTAISIGFPTEEAARRGGRRKSMTSIDHRNHYGTDHK
jgi:nitroreductase